MKLFASEYKFPRNIKEFLLYDIPRIWFMMRHGFDYRDCWSMDIALAEWLAPRLRHLASTTHGCPPRYGLTSLELAAEVYNDLNHDFDSQFKLWILDINKAANQLQAFIDIQDDDNWTVEKDRQVTDAAHEAFKWVANNIGALWD